MPEEPQPDAFRPPGYPWRHRVLLAVYDLVWLVALAVWLSYRLVMLPRHGRAAIAQRLGKVPQRPSGYTRSIWIHAVSVGEILAAKPLIAEIRRHHPNWWILLSTNECHAWQLAQQGVGTHAVCKVPWDLSWCIKRALRRAGTDTLVLIECELWPNMIVRAADRGCSLALMNARLYERDFPTYRRMRWFFRPLLRMIRLIGCQSEQDLSRFVEIGAGCQQAQAFGNTKFDVKLPDDLPEKLAALAHLRDPVQSMVVVASTHANEEALILSAIEARRNDFPMVQWLVAPRHPTRAGDVQNIAESAGFSTRLRSTVAPGETPVENILILDTIGELPTLLALADVVFVGGSLVDLGGHNVIEPALHAKATLTGPSVYNFKEITEAFLSAEAIVQVRNASELLERVQELLDNRDRRIELGQKARLVVESQSGCVEHWVKVLDQFGCLGARTWATVAESETRFAPTTQCGTMNDRSGRE